MGTVYPEFTTHLTVFFDDSLCGLKRLNKRDLTYNLDKVTCVDCLEKSRVEQIESDKAIATVPHCPHCGGKIKYVTLTFTVTKLFSFDIQTERQEGKIVPLIYGTNYDTLDTEFVPEKEWQVMCENDHEWFTKKIEPLEDGEQWVIVDGADNDEVGRYPDKRLCPVCGNDRSEHDWEVHTAELKANSYEG